jgi:hypothetical protein
MSWFLVGLAVGGLLMGGAFIALLHVTAQIMSRIATAMI